MKPKRAQIVFMKEQESIGEEDVYSTEFLESDNDIPLEEQGFMLGYLQS